MIFRINGKKYPKIRATLELVPIARLILEQPFPSDQPLAKFGAQVLADTEQNTGSDVTVEAFDGKGNLVYKAVGPVTEYSVYHASWETPYRYEGEAERLTIGYTSLDLAPTKQLGE